MQHFRIATYDVTKGTTREVADLAKAGLLEIFRAQPGFQAYSVIEVDPKTVVSLSIWESHEEAEDAVSVAANWVAEAVADWVELTSNTIGDALFWAAAAN